MPWINKNELIKNIILLFVVLIVCFIFLEVIFNLLGIGESNKELSHKYIKHSDYNPFLIFPPHFNREFKQSNNEIAYWNSQGFRLKENLPLEKDLSEYRIIALGGSTTENLSNGQNLHYPLEASKLLNYDNTLKKHFNIINAGRSAYSTAHNLIRLQFDLLPFKPDMITVMHNMNDLTVNFFPYLDDRNNYANKYLYNYYAESIDSKEVFIEIVKKSRFITFAFRSLKNIKEILFSKKVLSKEGKKVYSTMRFSENPIKLRAKDVFKNNLIAIAEIGKAHNIQVVFLSQPATFSDDKIALTFGHKPFNHYIYYPKKDEFIECFEKYNKIIAEVADQENIFYIDMYNLMGHEDKYFKDMVHFTEEGIIRFSKIYAQKLKKIIELEAEYEQK